MDDQVTRLLLDESKSYYKETLTFAVATRHKLNDRCDRADATCMGGYARTRFHARHHEQPKTRPTIRLYDHYLWEG